jgi:hypothetical protein
VTAEFMIGLPVVIGVATALMMGGQAGLTQQRLGHYAADYARVLSHGGEPGGLTPPHLGVGVEVDSRDELVCVEASYTHAGGLWSITPLEQRQRACALAPPAW